MQASMTVSQARCIHALNQRINLQVLAFFVSREKQVPPPFLQAEVGGELVEWKWQRFPVEYWSLRSAASLWFKLIGPHWKAHVQKIADGKGEGWKAHIVNEGLTVKLDMSQRFTKKRKTGAAEKNVPSKQLKMN